MRGSGAAIILGMYVLLPKSTLVDALTESFLVICQANPLLRNPTQSQ